MSSRLRWRLPGAALVALALDILLGPIQSQIWNGPDAPAWIGVLIWPDVARPLMQNILAPMLGAEPYEIFGRLTILVYLGCLAAWSPFVACPNRRQHMAAALAWMALAVAALADIGTYWIAGLHNEALRSVTFWQIEIPAMALAVLIMAVIGIDEIRRGERSLLNIVLAASPLIAAAATSALQYMPHGPLFAISLGAWTLASRSCRGRPV